MTLKTRAREESVKFAEIVCADPDWVAAEFEQIVSSIVAAPLSTAASPRSPGGRPTLVRSLRPKPDARRLHELPERVRAPPL